MSVEFKILPEYGVVYVRYEGVAVAEDTMDVFARYMVHPDFQPGLKQFVDLSRLTGIDANYLDVMKLQMMKTEAFLQGSAQTLLVYYAPTEVAMEMARLAARAWDGVARVVTMVQQNEADAMALIGLQGQRMDDLMPSPAEQSSSDL